MIELQKISSVTEKVSKWDPRKESVDEIISYIDLSTVDKEDKRIIDDNIAVILGKDAPSRARQIVKQNDILVSTVRPNLNGVAIVEKEYKNATASTGYSVLRCKPNSYFRYLYYWTLTPAFVEDMINKSSGASYPAVSDKIIKESKIPLPPLETQKKIASILDAADAYRQKTKALIQKYDELTQSLFLEMFGDPVTNPKGWEKVQIDKACSKVTDGTHDTPERIDKGIQFITGKHIRPYKISFNSCDYVAPEVHKEIYRRCNPEYGDVLYTNIGANVGTAAFNNVRYEFSMKNVALFKPLKTDLNGRFLEYFLNSENMKEEVIRIASLGGAQKFLSLKDLRKLKVALPPIEIQNDFEVRIEKIEEQKVQTQESLEKAEELFNSLLQRAFKGKI